LKEFGLIFKTLYAYIYEGVQILHEGNNNY